jgi:hypothetical protein
MNDEAAMQCNIAVLTVRTAPFSAESCGRAGGQSLVERRGADIGVSMPPAERRQEAQEILVRGEWWRPFRTFPATWPTHPIACDVWSAATVRQPGLQLVDAAGLTGWDAGPLQNAMVVEGLTSLLLGINKRYKIRGAGIRITGEPSAPRG